MMFGLGDCPNPLESTAKVIEEIVLDQLHSILAQAEEISARRNAKIISPQDLLFLMRNDALKLQRLINYLGTFIVANDDHNHQYFTEHFLHSFFSSERPKIRISKRFSILQ